MKRTTTLKSGATRTYVYEITKDGEKVGRRKIDQYDSGVNYKRLFLLSLHDYVEELESKL